MVLACATRILSAKELASVEMAIVKAPASALHSLMIAQLTNRKTSEAQIAARMMVNVMETEPAHPLDIVMEIATAILHQPQMAARTTRVTTYSDPTDAWLMETATETDSATILGAQENLAAL